MAVDEAATEEWRPVAGYEGLYDVSNLGNVRTWLVRGSKFGRISDTPRLLSPGKGQAGRRNVSLCGIGRPRTRIISHLVAEAFIGPRPEGLVICHGNGDASDDRPENLRYDTQKANVEDALRHGTLRHGERHPNTRLTAVEVTDIRQRVGAGENQRLVAESFGVTTGCVESIHARKSWKHVA